MKKLLPALAALLGAFAAATVTPASWIIWINHPKVPKSLLKDQTEK